MIYKVTIELDANCVSCCEVFTDEDKLCEYVDHVLNENNVNDGCSFLSIEDEIAANATIAELCNDPMNVDNFLNIEDITEEVLFRVQSLFAEHSWSDEALIAMADDMGLDLKSVSAA